MPTVPQTLYSTPDPHREISELYVVNAEELAVATDPKRRWIVKEQHGYWDEQAKKFLMQVVTLKPSEPKYCVTLNKCKTSGEWRSLRRPRNGIPQWSADRSYRRFISPNPGAEYVTTCDVTVAVEMMLVRPGG
jgi:hypothetical protein